MRSFLPALTSRRTSVGCESMTQRGARLAGDVAKGSAQPLHERREDRAAVREVRTGRLPGEKPAHRGIEGEPVVIAVVRLEAEKLLKHREAEDLAVVDVGRGPGTRDEFAAACDEAGLAERVVEGAAGRRDDVFQVERGSGGHGGPPVTCPPQPPVLSATTPRDSITSLRQQLAQGILL